MIYDDRYPTASELVPGVDITAAVHTIPTSFDTLMNPYYIGYIPFEMFPKNWCINTHEIAPDTITITQLKQNVPFGFCYQTADYSQLFYKDAGGTCRKYNNNSDCHFVNKLCIADLTYVDYIRLEVMVITAPTDKVIDDGAFSFGTPNNTTYDFRRQNFTVTIDISTLDAFINNNGTITINGVIINGQSENITLSYSDFTNVIAYKTTSTHTIRAQIYNVAIGRSSKYKNGSTAANIVPFIGIDCPAGSVPEQRYMALLFEWQSYYTLTYDNLGNFGSLSVGMDVSGYSIGRYQTDHLYRDEIVDLAAQLEYASLLNMNGWYRHQYFEYSGGNSFRLYPAIDFTDIWYIVSLINKIEIGASSAASITATDTYYDTQSTALYTGSNATTQNRAIENYVPDLLYQLQPWQQPNIDITANEFTNDDVPPYEPTPTDDDERSFGVDYEPNRAYSIGTLGGFITQYAMTQDQIAQFGHYLWAAFDDSDFWDSISVILPESLSLNPSDILKYIISVRMFPFSLSGMPSFSPGSDSKIYIGRGFKPIDINTQMAVGTIDSYTEDIDGGYADIPEFHGDFRDYEPCARATVTIPFCGSLELVPSQIVGARVHLRYGVDYSTGAVQATVTVENGKKYIAGILNGSIGATVQMTASNLSQVLQGGIKAGAEIVKTAALIAATGAVESAEVAAGGEASMSTELASRIPSSGANSINSILSLDSVPPQQISMSNGFASMQVTSANVRLEFRHYTKPSNYAHTHGYACDKTVTLGSLEGKGFTVCKNVDLTGVPATQEELAILEQLLQSGVYL